MSKEQFEHKNELNCEVTVFESADDCRIYLSVVQNPLK